MEKNVCTKDSCMCSDKVMYAANLTYRGFISCRTPDTKSGCLTCDVNYFKHKIFFHSLIKKRSSGGPLSSKS